MEEMRAAAMAYYANLSNSEQQKVLGFFQSIDANGDGKVSIQEYSDFIAGSGCNYLPTNLFKLLDKNDDGTLDFEECVTFFYMVTSSRLVNCDGCGNYMLGLYFLCVECHKEYCKSKKEQTYDLCCSCYRNKNFSHEHSSFMDNYALLRTKTSKSKTSRAVRALSNTATLADAANTFYNVGSAAGCSIM